MANRIKPSADYTDFTDEKRLSFLGLGKRCNLRNLGIRLWLNADIDDAHTC
jgi:hypothetical protein